MKGSIDFQTLDCDIYNIQKRGCAVDLTLELKVCKHCDKGRGNSHLLLERGV